MKPKGMALVAVVYACVVMGCGSSSDESKPVGEPGTPNKQAATSTTQATISAVQTAIRPSAGGESSGQQSANQLVNAAQTTQNIVQPGPTTTAQQSLFGSIGLASRLSPLDNAPGTSGTCTCTETSCTFEGCTMGLVTIDGTYSWGGGHVQCTGLAYTVKVAQGGVSADIKIDLECDLTVTETSLDGTFHSKGRASSAYGSYVSVNDWDTKIEFESITFPSGGGAPTGGGQHVEGTTTTTINGESKTYSARFDVTFPSN